MGDPIQLLQKILHGGIVKFTGIGEHLVMVCPSAQKMHIKIFGAVTGTMTSLEASLLMNVVLPRCYGVLFPVFRKTEGAFVDQKQHIIPTHPVDIAFVFFKEPEGRMFISNGTI